MVQLLWKTSWQFLKKLNTDTIGPRIPLLGIPPKDLKTGTQTNICTDMFIVAPLTVLKRQKQPT